MHLVDKALLSLKRLESTDFPTILSTLTLRDGRGIMRLPRNNRGGSKKKVCTNQSTDFQKWAKNTLDKAPRILYDV